MTHLPYMWVKPAGQYLKGVESIGEPGGAGKRSHTYGNTRRQSMEEIAPPSSL